MTNRPAYRKRRERARRARIYLRVSCQKKVSIEHRARNRGMSVTAHLLDCEARWAREQEALAQQSDD